MIRSMTGFGQAEGAVGCARVVVEIRTVNHRFFSPSIRLPSVFAKWEPEVRELLRSRINRGHVTLGVRIERAEAPGASINQERFAAAVEELRLLSKRHNLPADVDLTSILRMPDVISSAREDEEIGELPELLAILEQALVVLNGFREAEGGRLAAVLLQRLELVAAAVERIALRAPARLIAHRDRLRSAVRDLADGITIDEQRLAQEVAILADRLDVSEETDRFRSHVTAFRTALGDGASEPAGKRLGFLLQEMLREANTTGSKGADPEILHDVVGIKEELERIREQVENLE
jgi:uncharacterized protein (TIGR00255 family)